MHRLISHGTNLSSSPWINKIGISVFFPASDALSASRLNLPQIRADSLTKVIIREGMSFIFFMTQEIMDIGEE